MSVCLTHLSRLTPRGCLHVTRARSGAKAAGTGPRDQQGAARRLNRYPRAKSRTSLERHPPAGGAAGRGVRHAAVPECRDKSTSLASRLPRTEVSVHSHRAAAILSQPEIIGDPRRARSGPAGRFRLSTVPRP